MQATRINYDILAYLPDDVDTVKGENILTNEFNMGSYSIVITENMSTKDIQKIESYHKTLNIKKLYENHKDIVKELLQKRVMYSDSYIDELFDKYSGILFSSKEELMRLITCGYISDDDINKRPLSKLIKDISEDLGFR
jgi:hypothetical protein